MNDLWDLETRDSSSWNSVVLLTENNLTKMAQKINELVEEVNELREILNQHRLKRRDDSCDD